MGPADEPDIEDEGEEPIAITWLAQEQLDEIVEYLHGPRDSVSHPRRDSPYALERIEWQLNQIRGAVMVVALILLFSGFIVITVSATP